MSNIERGIALGTLLAYLLLVWQPGDVHVEIEEADHRTVIAVVRTPVGTLRVIAEFELVDGVLWARNAHIQGLSPGRLGRVGLNLIARQFLEEVDAQALVVEGATRTTGARPGRRPRRFQFFR